jgi:hypothetical protein
VKTWQHLVKVGDSVRGHDYYLGEPVQGTVVRADAIYVYVRTTDGEKRVRRADLER